jgi:fatty-acid desaturase
MQHSTQLKILHAINHTLFLFGIYYIATTALYEWAVVAMLFYIFVVVVGQNIGLHRYLSHKSFETHHLISYILCFVAVLATTGSPLVWVAAHRAHHRYSDKTGDPHSPTHTSLFYIIFSWNSWGRERIDFAMSKDILRSTFHQRVHRYYSLIILGYCTILFLINPLLVVFVYAIPAVLCFYSGGVVNAFSHKYGYRIHDTSDNSTNNVWVSLFSFGEGWHNNHHHKPQNWKQGERWWEFDPSAMIIRIIKR